MVLLNQESRLLTGSADSELRAWDISYLQEVRTEEGGRWRQVNCCSVASTSFLSLSQERAEGEPKVKKGKSLLDDDSDEEEAAEEGDEGVEEVSRRLLPSDNCPWISLQLNSLLFYFFQRILRCKKAGSILREARDRVVSLTTDSRAKVIACHVSVSHCFPAGGINATVSHVCSNKGLYFT